MASRLAAGTERSMVGFVVLVTHTPRKTRSRLLVKLCRTGFSPVEAPLKGFYLNFSWISPFHELLGAMNDYALVKPGMGAG
jgi:hypothetical protein